MSGLVNVLVIVAVAALVIVRLFRTRRFDADRRWWLVPAVLTVVALREPALLDPDHHGASAAQLTAELLIGLGTGAGWGWTTRIWAGQDGTVWTRSSTASAAVWIGGIALRIGLAVLGSSLGIRQGSAAVLLTLALTLLTRSAVMALRARSLTVPAAGASPACGDGKARTAWKERV